MVPIIAVSCSLPSIPPAKKRRLNTPGELGREVQAALTARMRMLFDAGGPFSLMTVPGLILVIEDEPGIVDFLERGLSAQGFEVISALDGDAGLERALGEDIDLVVLDMMLPGAQRIRGPRTATGGEARAARDRADGAGRGRRPGLRPRRRRADYLTKPFSLTELAARIRAQLRVASQVPQTTLAGGGVEVDLLTREVRRGGDPVRLSTTEFELLAYLMRNRGKSSPASRSSGPSGAMSMTRARTSLTSTSVI